MLKICLEYNDTLSIRAELAVLVAKYDADALRSCDPDTIAMMERAAARTRKVYNVVQNAVVASIA